MCARADVKLDALSIINSVMMDSHSSEHVDPKQIDSNEGERVRGRGGGGRNAHLWEEGAGGGG